MELNNVSFAYGEVPIIKDISLKIKQNAVTTIIGANGCGKTTLLRLMTRALRAKSGEIRLDGRNIESISARELARRAAVVQQKNTAPDDLTVQGLVAYGRLPYRSILSYTGANDDKVKRAMSMTGIAELAQRRMGELSGGQRQRAFIAMALAQDTKLLFLDEPTTFLDVRYQIEILRLVRRLNKEEDMTVVMVLHDINQAIAYSDEIIALSEGRLYAQGKPDAVINERTVKDIYGIELRVGEIGGMKTVLAV